MASPSPPPPTGSGGLGSSGPPSPGSGPRPAAAVTPPSDGCVVGCSGVWAWPSTTAGAPSPDPPWAPSAITTGSGGLDFSGPPSPGSGPRPAAAVTPPSDGCVVGCSGVWAWPSTTAGAPSPDPPWAPSVSTTGSGGLGSSGSPSPASSPWPTAAAIPPSDGCAAGSGVWAWPSTTAGAPSAGAPSAPVAPSGSPSSPSTG